MIEKFYDATVLAAISNTDYEGEIKKQGDKVKIRTRPTAVIRDYTRNTDINYDMPDGGVIDLDIDKGKYYAAQIDDVSAHQQDIKVMDAWGDRPDDVFAHSLESPAKRFVQQRDADDVVWRRHYPQCWVRVPVAVGGDKTSIPVDVPRHPLPGWVIRLVHCTVPANNCYLLAYTPDIFIRAQHVAAVHKL